jgi:hypothetical protein
MTAAHILIKEIDPDDPDGFRYRIECRAPKSCDGWIECDLVHAVGGLSADDEGPFDCHPDDPWFGREEFEFHGVIHTWQGEHGWTAPFEGCVVAWADWVPPEEMETLPAGRYEVEDDWDDTSVHLDYVGPEEVSS